MNKVFLSGRLTRDPEVKTSQAGKSYTRVGIAVDRRFSKGNEADFFTLIAFGKTAEFIGNWFSKGSKILVEGAVQIDNYEDKEGIKRKDVAVLVDQVEFADSKKKDSGNNSWRNDEDNTPPEDDFPF